MKAVSSGSVASAPTSVTLSTINAAVSTVARQAATGHAIRVNAAAHTDGVLKTMLLAKLDPAAAALLAAVLVVLPPSLVATATADRPAATIAQTDKKPEVKVKWEYKALTAADIEKLAPKGSQDKLTDGLDSLGDQGWELVAVAPGFHDLGVPGGLGLQPAGRPPMPPGGPGGPGMLPGAPGMKPNMFMFKRPK